MESEEVPCGSPDGIDCHSHRRRHGWELADEGETIFAHETEGEQDDTSEIRLDYGLPTKSPTDGGHVGKEQSTGDD